MDAIHAANEVSFRIGFSGHSGHLRLEPLSPVERSNPLRSLPDFIIPPAFKEETPETVKKSLEEKYLVPELDSDEFSAEKSGRQWDFDWFDMAKVHLEPSVPRSVVIPQWELPFRRLKATGDVWEPKSVQIDVNELMEGSQEPGSLPRMPGPAKDFVRGSINNRPFQPGGLDSSQNSAKMLPEGARSGEWVREVLSGSVAQTIPPSFKQGMDLGCLQEHPYRWRSVMIESVTQSSSEENTGWLSVKFDDMFSDTWEEDMAEQVADDGTTSSEELIKQEHENILERSPINSAPETGSLVLDEILSTEAGGLKSKIDGTNNQQKEVWAVDGDSEGIANRFHDLVPDMALDFPFELDKFQKEHCTRAVYTAPIKTISNQKYRDFCGKFDVGLLTGDVSIKPDASCLIMTTEILRSMLYRGADIIRDIEWFDSLEVLLLFMNQVPNTIEFADWIGRTKQKKIRVTGTSKRPVPLEHCLFYSGELYKICENETFVPQGLQAAKDVHKKKNSIVVGGGSGKSSGIAVAQARQRENINHGKMQKHPGNQAVDNLTGIDLTSSSEKSEIRVFCDKAFSRLKGSDRDLPQVVKVPNLLRRGIGVHHAGLLPIVKEVVEMLFCRGVIKVLFSTETFAMGVNAPARTVVFDTLRKFDGKDFRQLIPGEYIQMAGRAGRRGLDSIGTVIVMCRDDIPDERDLKNVMIGIPTKLESRFRLTYTMILHLLRVEELKVEDMLKRSFAEFHTQKKLPEQEKLLLLKLAQPTKAIECIKGEPAIEEYYEMAIEAEQHMDFISEIVMQTSTAQQFLLPGRVVVVKSRSIDQVRLLEFPSNAAYSKTVQELLDLKSQGNKYPPALDPLKDLKMKDMDLVEKYHRYNSLLQEMADNKCHGCIKLQEHVILVKELMKHRDEINKLRYQISDEALSKMPDFQGRIDVLKEICCIDSDHVVQIKGRVACEMNSGEELISTECLFENQLDDLEPEEAVAIMSALVFQQKKTSEPSLTPKLALAKQRLYKTAKRLGELQAHFKVSIDPEQYIEENLKFGLVEVVYEWAKGTPFADICELTDVPEGLIVRTIVRLDETCREFRNAAAIMGNSALHKKMEAASNAIKRDIVFAASLYVTGV
ncbi:hypothetical protein QJS10_CPB14g01721 [Acorus calamus]|uniref:Helicase C-terminal domain-containing protein n=1 Tax=Acorus calamus TaxID=4465 RepID=A0AAV9DBC0_ACOCL|nr:hypothetical protein QJS10_CPB14g01721 [Acorus calamus]